MADLQKLARRVASGEIEAFDALVVATQGSLLKLAARIVGDVDEAEDILQGAYLRAFDALTGGAFDGRARVETWLHSIVVNGARDAYRVRKRRDVRLSDMALSDRVGPETALARVALRELADLLEGLPEEQRTALVLKEVEGMTSSEVAKTLGISEGAVEQRLVRARQTLRERMQHE